MITKPNDKQRDEAISKLSDEIYQSLTQPTLKVPEEIDGYELSYNYNDVSIVGNKYITGFDINSLEPGQKIELIPEPNNEYDSKAILAVCDGKKIGYVSKGRVQEMISDYIRKELPIFSVIENINYDESYINMFIAFYK